MFGYIYMTTNLINNKKYIGKCKSSEFNFNYKGSGKYLKLAVKKYGIDNFNVEMIDTYENESEGCQKEKYYIALNDAVNSKEFYNIADGGQGGGVVGEYTSERKLKISMKIKQLWKNEEYRKTQSQKHKGQSTWNKGLHYSLQPRPEEVKEKISKAQKGKPRGYIAHQKLITFNGETHNIKEWASIFNVSQYIIGKRIKAGKNIDGSIITTQEVSA